MAVVENVGEYSTLWRYKLTSAPQTPQNIKVKNKNKKGMTMRSVVFNNLRFICQKLRWFKTRNWSNMDVLAWC